MRAVPARLEEAIRTLLDEKSRVAAAIDGPCGSGKSTLAEALSLMFPDSLVIRADDFFLRPHQRTAERLKEPGGNLDRERLKEEVLAPLKQGSYQGHHRYNCQTGAMEPVPGNVGPLAIVEGSYTHHPDLREYYDLAVFLDIGAETQLKRLRARCRDEALFQRFKSLWIPLENAYFSRLQIREQADILIPAE